jgi:hypothetical protein
MPDSQSAAAPTVAPSMGARPAPWRPGR